MPKKRDLTAEKKYRLLLQLSHDVRDTLDIDEILEHLLDVIESLLDSDAAGIFVLNQEMVYPVAGKPKTFIAGIVQRGFDPRPVETDQMLMEGKGIVGHVIRTGESLVVRDVRHDPRYVIGRDRTKSEIAIPIVRNGRTIGALNLESDRLSAFDTGDLEILRFFAEAAAISISKAILHQQLLRKERIEEQLRIAHVVQSRLLPEAPPEVLGYEIAGICIPTFEIGGDYFDHIRLQDGRLGIVVADVAGKGIPAALIMAAFKALLRAHAGVEPSLQELVARINRQIHDFTGPTGYVTAVYGILETASGRFEYANCGHNAPLLVRSSGRIERLESGGTFLGVFDNVEYETRAVVLEHGDALILYTDGVVECEDSNGQDLGIGRFEDLARSTIGLAASQVIDRILDATRLHSASSGFQDDFTVLVVRRPPAGGVR